MTAIASLSLALLGLNAALVGTPVGALLLGGSALIAGGIFAAKRLRFDINPVLGQDDGGHDYIDGRRKPLTIDDTGQVEGRSPGQRAPISLPSLNVFRRLTEAEKAQLRSPAFSVASNPSAQVAAQVPAAAAAPMSAVIPRFAAGASSDPLSVALPRQAAGTSAPPLTVQRPRAGQATAGVQAPRETVARVQIEATVPKGTRVTVDPKSTAPVSIRQRTLMGLSMAEAY